MSFSLRVEEDIIDQDKIDLSSFKFLPLSDDKVSMLLPSDIIRDEIKSKDMKRIWKTSQLKRELSSNMKALAELLFLKTHNSFSYERATEDIWSFSKRGYMMGTVHFIRAQEEMDCPLIFTSKSNWYLVAPILTPNKFQMSFDYDEHEFDKVPRWMSDKIIQHRVRSELKGDEE